MARTPDLRAIKAHPHAGVEKLESEQDIFAFLADVFASWAKNDSYLRRNFLSVTQVKSLRPGEKLSGALNYEHDSLVFASTFSATREGLVDGTTLRKVKVSLSNGADPSTTVYRNQILANRYRNERKRDRARTLEPAEVALYFSRIRQFALEWVGSGVEQPEQTFFAYFNGSDVSFDITWNNVVEQEKIVFELFFHKEKGIPVNQGEEQLHEGASGTDE